MPPRPLTSCRRLEHNLTTSFEYVWISEEDLYNALQRFCSTSNTIRRHGSSVPGPMESRRRFERRRMAHVTDMTQAPIYDPRAIWCASWGPEKIESQWRAPTPRITEQSKHPLNLSSWLSNWTPVFKQPLDGNTDVGNSEEATERGHDVLRQERGIEDDFNDFSTAIRGMKTKRINYTYRFTKALELCLSFSEKLEKSLALGLVSSDLLSSILQAVTDVLMEFSSGSDSNTEGSPEKNLGISVCFSRSMVGVTEHLLAFYTRVWNGIVSCTVLKPADFDSKVMGEYLSLLARLPSTNKTQLLISRILSSLSTSQLDSNIDATLSLLNQWALSWLKKSKTSGNVHEYFTKAEASLVASDKLLDRIDRVTWQKSFKLTPELIQRIRDALIRTLEILSAAKSELWAAEDMLICHTHSVHMMSITLTNLPREVLYNLIRAYSEVIKSSSFLDRKIVRGPRNYLAKIHRVRFNWLSVISKLENAETSIFTETFKTLKQQDLNHFRILHALTFRQTAQLLLNHWASQGLPKHASAIIETFKLKSISSPNPYGCFLYALRKYNQLGVEKIHNLLEFLLDIGEFSHIEAVLMGSKLFNVRIDPKIVADLVNNISSVNPELAFRLYMRHCKGNIEPEACAPLITAMIFDGHKKVWSVLDNPTIPKDGSATPDVLLQSRIDLIHDMAKAFAKIHVEKQNKKRVLRNITRCWRYLRAHNVQPTSEVSRALTEVCIISDIRDGKWGRTERIKWALEVIRKVEGKDVSNAVQKFVARWRENLVSRGWT